MKAFFCALLLVGVGAGAVFWFLAGRQGSEPAAVSLGVLTRNARPLPPMRSTSGTGIGEVGGTTPAPVPTYLERFRQISGEAMAALPRVSELLDLSEEELHSRPLPLQRAGAALGRVAQALQADSRLKQEAIGFYTECAERPELVRTVRALCYRDLVRLGGADLRVAVPGEVKRLADEIP